jgi:hypothetical protein
MSLSARPCLVLAAVASLCVAAPAASADQGAVQIVAVAPAFCRVTAMPHAPTLANGAFGVRACNTVNEAQITARVSNLDGAALRFGSTDIAVSASGLATFSPQQLATLSDLRVVGARPAVTAPIVELTITPQ